MFPGIVNPSALASGAFDVASEIASGANTLVDKVGPIAGAYAAYKSVPRAARLLGAYPLGSFGERFYTRPALFKAAYDLNRIRPIFRKPYQNNYNAIRKRWIPRTLYGAQTQRRLLQARWQRTNKKRRILRSVQKRYGNDSYRHSMGRRTQVPRRNRTQRKFSNRSIRNVQSNRRRMDYRNRNW